MKIGIFSDTHDKLENVKKAIELFQKEKVELVIHCGDWVSPFVPQYIYSLEPKFTIPIKTVFGNNEGDQFRFFQRKEKEGWNIEFQKEIMTLEVDSKKIVIYHGSDKIITASLIECKKYDIVLTGHTHKALVETVNGVLHINPGSAAGYCGGQIENSGTVVLYNSFTNSAEIISL